MYLLQSRSERPRFDGTSLRRRKRLVWLILAVGVAVIAAAWFEKDGALRTYRDWKRQRALQQARTYFASHDIADAQVALEVAFSAMPGSIETYRAAADMLEQVGSPQSLRLRRQVVQTMSSSSQDYAALVQCAIRFRDFNLARDTLGSMTPLQADQPAALGAALSFALNTDNLPMADSLFDRLKRLGHDTDDLKVGQAILHLRHPRPEVAAAARRELETMARNPKYALRIRRELVSDALLRRDYGAARQWSALVVADPQSNLADRLHAANMDLIVDKRPFAEIFRQLSPLAAANPANATEFARWMLVQGRAAEADRWLAGLDPAVRKDPGVAYVWAETVAQQKDWDRLGSMLEAGAWGQVSQDTIRLAMSAKLVRMHGGPDLEGAVWDQAVKSAEENLSALGVLQQLTAVWDWQPESERTLWAIARHYRDQTWAHQALFNIYKSRNDTANMREIMGLLRDLDGSVPRYQHDWALLSLLLEPTLVWNTPKTTLKQLYLAEPSNPYYATSYAFALTQSGRPKEALAIVGKLTPAERDYLPRLPYLAYVYGFNRMRGEVERLEAIARNGAMLPEERLLFVEAHEALDRRPEPPPAPAKGARLTPKP